uniref:Phosphatidylethanolamine-binding protein homolog F40A3.3 n=1 Tax=Cacopsylla melanoneura TaxID=428564 RepID=A0A8D9BV51_9HEMI
MARMKETWSYLIQVIIVSIVLEFQEIISIPMPDEEMGDIGETPPDPVKEMLARFDKSPWTVFPTETTTSRLQRDMSRYMDQFWPMQDLEKEMNIHGLIPEHLPLCPTHTLDVRYHFKHKEPSFWRKIDLAEIYEPHQVAELPRLKYPTKPNTSYIHMLIDPDHTCTRFEPSIDSSYEDLYPTTTDDLDNPQAFVHFLKVNVPSENITHGGETIVEHLPPHPPNTTGLHRYTWLVYEQPHQNMTFTEKRIPNTTAYERDWFRLNHFTHKYNLSMDPPLAGIFFYSKFDESVPYIYAHLHDVFI